MKRDTCGAEYSVGGVIGEPNVAPNFVLDYGNMNVHVEPIMSAHQVIRRVISFHFRLLTQRQECLPYTQETTVRVRDGLPWVVRLMDKPSRYERDIVGFDSHTTLHFMDCW